MSLKPGDVLALQFTTAADTGALTNADSLPTGTLVKDGADTVEVVTVTNLATGTYSASVTVPGGYVAGDVVQVRIAATIAAVATGGVIFTGVIDSHRNGDIDTALATVDANVDAILVDTGTDLPATLVTIAAYIDTEVAAILQDTGTDIPALIAALQTVADAIKAKTDSLTFTKANELDANMQSINGTTLVGDGSATPWGP